MDYPLGGKKEFRPLFKQQSVRRGYDVLMKRWSFPQIYVSVLVTKCGEIETERGKLLHQSAYTDGICVTENKGNSKPGDLTLESLK